ncbi:hypothetical protein BDV93DRAFT_524628 [Ceratobasidium sp. AG-I]|nr:hypothetical protein BDV93DRAFT_524628 [Ceratobasidium sp. AG-I]
MSPEPLCASCNSPFIEQLSPDEAQVDDPRAFNAFSRLFEGGQLPHDHADRTPGGGPRGISEAINPIGQILGTLLGMRSLAPTTPGRSPPEPPSGSGRPTISIRRGDSEGRSSSGSRMQFNFQSGSGGNSTSSGGFGFFGGLGEGTARRGSGNRDPEPPSVDEFLSAWFQNDRPPRNAQGQGQGARPSPSPLLQNMLMGLFGAGIGHPGLGVGASGDGRWGDYALNQEALDQIITQLMEGGNAAPVPAPDDMIASWPRTILTPGNPLENEDCAICKDSFAFIPPDSTTEPTAEEKEKNKEDVQPQEALTLPCKHSFHEECIVPWVRVKGTCPVCRFELIGQAGGRNPARTEGGGDAGGGDAGERSEGGDSGGPWRRESEGGGGGSAGARLGRHEEPDRRGSPMPPGAYELD